MTMANMTEEEFADLLVASRRKGAAIGAALGGFYAQLKLNGMPDEEASFNLSKLFDRLVDSPMETEVTADVKLSREHFEAFLHPKQ